MWACNADRSGDCASGGARASWSPGTSRPLPLHHVHSRDINMTCACTRTCALVLPPRLSRPSSVLLALLAGFLSRHAPRPIFVWAPCARPTTIHNQNVPLPRAPSVPKPGRPPQWQHPFARQAPSKALFWQLAVGVSCMARLHLTPSGFPRLPPSCFVEPLTPRIPNEWSP